MLTLQLRDKECEALRWPSAVLLALACRARLHKPRGWVSTAKFKSKGDCWRGVWIKPYM